MSLGTLRGSEYQSFADANTRTSEIPSDTEDGDLLIAYAALSHEDTAATGITVNSGTWATTVFPRVSEIGLSAVLTRVWHDGDPTVYTFGKTGSTTPGTFAVVIVKVGNPGDIVVTPVATNLPVSSTAVVCPGAVVPPADGDSAVIRFYHTYYYQPSKAGTDTFQQPSGHAELCDQSDEWCSIGASYVTSPAGEVSGAVAVAGAYTSGARSRGVTLVVAPAADPAPPPPPPVTAIPSRPAGWAFILGPPAPGGGHDWVVSNAKARRATFRLVSPSEAAFDIDGHDPIAAKIVELQTDLHVLRTRPNGSGADLLFRGRIGPTGDTLDANGHKVTVTAHDYREVLNRRQLYPDSKLVWDNTEQAVIGMELINQTQIRPGGALGIGPGVGSSTGVSRDRTEYEAGDVIGQRLQELSEVIDGFDWDITPATPTLLQLDIWYPMRGLDRSVVLEYGGLLSGVNRNVDTSKYANGVQLTGQTPEGGDEPPARVVREAADLGSRPEGRWDATFGTSIVTDASLAERGDWQLDEAQVVRPSYTVTLKPGAWRGPGHIWLGDPVRLVIMSGRLRVDSILRVFEIDVRILDDGSEVVQMTIGAPKPDYRKRATDIERRLRSLERR